MYKNTLFYTIAAKKNIKFLTRESAGIYLSGLKKFGTHSDLSQKIHKLKINK